MRMWLSLLFVALPLAVFADCAQECTSSCSGAQGQPYEDCMVTCLQDCQRYDPPPVPEVPAPTPVQE